MSVEVAFTRHHRWIWSVRDGRRDSVCGPKLRLAMPGEYRIWIWPIFRDEYGSCPGGHRSWAASWTRLRRRSGFACPYCWCIAVAHGARQAKGSGRRRHGPSGHVAWLGTHVVDVEAMEQE